MLGAVLVFSVTGGAAGAGVEDRFDSLAKGFDQKVPEALAAEQIPGAVLLVGLRTDDGYRVWQKAYGLKRSQPQAEPMPVDAIFDLASMTKPIATGTAMMLLVERGRVSLDDPVAKHLPCFEGEQKADVRIRDLMTHCSGLPPYVGKTQRDELEKEFAWPCPGPIRDFICRLALSDPPPRTMVVYSCLNAILSAEVVRAVSGRPLNDFVEDNAYRPLGLRDTGFLPQGDLIARCVPTTKEEHSGEEFLQGMVHDPLAAMQGGVSGNAGLFSSAQDISRFAQMLLNEGELDGVRIFQPETVRLMTSIQTPAGIKGKSGNEDRRGLLWDVYAPDPGDTGMNTVYAYGHTGYTGTAIRVYPEHGMYVIALTNRVHPDDTGKVSEFRKMAWATAGKEILGIE